MKKLIFFVFFLPVFFSCEKDGPIEKEPIIVDQFVGTSWIAVNDIAELIYGGKCTLTIEFLGNGACQEIDERSSGSLFGPSLKVNLGTYTFKNDSVTWRVGDRTISGLKSGSVITTNMGTVNGGKRIYQKK